jgi:hypothetical protein
MLVARDMRSPLECARGGLQANPPPERMFLDGASLGSPKCLLARLILASWRMRLRRRIACEIACASSQVGLASTSRICSHNRAVWAQGFGFVGIKNARATQTYLILRDAPDAQPLLRAVVGTRRPRGVG